MSDAIEALEAAKNKLCSGCKQGVRINRDGDMHLFPQLGSNPNPRVPVLCEAIEIREAISKLRGQP